MSEPVHVSSDSFEDEVVQSTLPVVVDFWADWCVPCKMIAPALAQLAQQYDGKVKIAKVDVDSHGDLAERFDIQSIPTLLVFKGGQVVQRQVGAVAKPGLEKMIQTA